MSKKTSKPPSDPRLALARNVLTLNKSLDKFVSDFKTVQEFHQNTLMDLGIEIEQKLEQKKRLDTEYKQKNDNLRIKLEQDLDEFGYKKAVEILATRGEIPVKATEHKQLISRLAELTENHATELEKLRADFKHRTEKAVSGALRTQALEAKAREAQLTSENNQLNKTIETQKEALVLAERRLDESRKLTETVAQAASNPSVVQNYGQN